MRTTVSIADELLSQAKQAAARSGRTLSAVIEDALRQSLAAPRSAPRQPVRLPTFGGRLQPGADLDDSAALVELMDGDAAAS
ncbi:MAG: ribbon-helix-helix domain-containing protein [Actinobacteria bacterium]|nr:ribbon-helix-helix domain-containing protein [Actinomycetota bacterium]